MAKITFQGDKLHTCGELPDIGASAPDFNLVNSKLADVNLASYAGKKKVLNIVPSLDTPVCAASTRIFNQKASAMENTVVLVVSADLPFAQSRFCEAEGLNNVIPVSTFRSSFSNDYGVTISEGFLRGLTTRAVIIIDENDKVTYTQLVREITEEPDYEHVMAAI